ncbi:DUF488 domain-containing protein [Halomicrobium salinisoli]|uniref:DUF488 domain-containing protein n=1 Tax=Halomicrobium salinisoli TaxID=2878391 RepID=UPI001CF0C356|nr:DUF488 domain-containing protein [Halomicrobium salinisoli]
MTGAVHDTYVAALQHDSAGLPADARRVGVVRKPTSWFHGAVDENRPELGPPPDLLEEFQALEEEFKVQGMCEEGAHNGAWDEVDFEERYRAHLESEAARAEVEELLDLLDSGTDVALVCYENTDDKRCHRTALREHLEERL